MGDLLDTFNMGLSFGSNILKSSGAMLGQADKVIGQEIGINLQRKESELRLSGKTFLEELQDSEFTDDGQHNSYQKAFDRYMQDIEERMTSPTINETDGTTVIKKANPNYSSTFFEQRKTDFMIEEYKNEMQSKLDGLIRQKKREQSMLNQQETIENERTIHAGEGQGRIDATGQILDSMLAQGLLSASHYQEELDRETAASSDEYFVTNYGPSSAAYSAALKAGSFNDIKKAVDEDPTRISYPSRITGDVSYAVNEQNAQDSKKRVMQVLEKNFRVDMQKQQQESDLKCNQDYNRLLMSNDIREQSNIAAGAINFIKQKTDNEMSPEDKTKWIKIFSSIQNNLGKTGRAYGTPGSKEQIESVKALIAADMPNLLMEHVKNGEISLASAKDGYQKYLEENFYSNVWKETQGMTEAEMENYYKDHVEMLPQSKFFSDSAVNAVLNRPENQDVKLAINQLEADMKKHPGDYAEDSASYFAQMYTDIVLNLDGASDRKAIVDRINKTVGAMKVGAMNSMFEKKWLTDKSTDKFSDKDIGQAAEVFENIDFVTVPAGKTDADAVYMNGSKEYIEKTGERFKDLVSEKMGVSSENLKVEFERQESAEGRGFKDDISGKMNIVDTVTGEVYSVIPTKNKNGKVTGYAIKTGSGQEYTEKDLKKMTKEKNRENDRNLSEKQNEARNQTKNALKNVNDFTEERNTMLNQKISSSQSASRIMTAAGKINREQWETESDLKNRQILLTDTVNKIDKDVKNLSDADFKSKYGLSRSEWEDMGRDAKWEYILDS